MKEPKIIEIAVFAVSSAICYPIMKYPPYVRFYYYKLKNQITYIYPRSPKTVFFDVVYRKTVS